MEQAKEEAGTKYDAGKPPMDLLPTEALVQIAKVLDFGRQKYDAHNWRAGMSWSRLIGAAMRHITAFNDGQDTDPETGLSHLAHGACCIMFLIDYQRTRPDFDDRYYSDQGTSSDQEKLPPEACPGVQGIYRSEDKSK